MYVLGNDAKRMSLEDDLTVLIDYEKYRERAQRRFSRQLNLVNRTSQLTSQLGNQFAQIFNNRFPVPFTYSSNFPTYLNTQMPSRDHYEDCGDRGIFENVSELSINKRLMAFFDQ